MNTVLFSHCWLDNPLPGYRSEDGVCRRLERFLIHYQDSWPTIVLDNGSKPRSCELFDAAAYAVGYDSHVINAQPHLKRGADWYYPNVWRAYQYIRDELFQQYDKVIFLATDAYICSQRLADYIEALDSGWTALWCAKWNFPATEIQVIMKGCKAFDDFFAGDPMRYNGACEEITVPLTHVERGFTGDRYGETETPYVAGMDWYSQVSDSLEWSDDVFPVLRRKGGKVIVE